VTAKEWEGLGGLPGNKSTTVEKC